jgi:hypothetical protein
MQVVLSGTSSQTQALPPNEPLIAIAIAIALLSNTLTNYHEAVVLESHQLQKRRDAKGTAIPSSTTVIHFAASILLKDRGSLSIRQ